MIWIMLVACRTGVGDVDGDGYTVTDGDCDDRNAVVFPEAIEVCDGVDNDCDGALDEDAGEDW